MPNPEFSSEPVSAVDQIETLSTVNELLLMSAVKGLEKHLANSAKRVEELEVENQRLKSRSEGHVEELKFKIEEIAALQRAKFKGFSRHDCWMWQGDGSDNLESLVCPVVIHAKDLLALTARLAAYESAIAGAVVDGATEGEWRIGDDTPPFYAGAADLIGKHSDDARDFIMGQFNWNFKELAIANAKQAALAVNTIRKLAAMAGGGDA